jgi:single-strand DNA-binding protein
VGVQNLYLRRLPVADINHVVLVGRLTRDAEIKYTSTGTAISKFSIAINRRRKINDQWTDEANFFDVVVWGRQAESLTPYLLKGKQIGVQGELRQNRWEQDGQPRSRVEVNASNIQLLGGRPAAQSAAAPMSDAMASGDEFESGDTEVPDDRFNDDIPF